MIPALRRLCILAVFCGTALKLTPLGGIKRVMNLLVTAVLMTQVLALIGNPMKILTSETASAGERERRLLLNAEETRLQMDRLVIEDRLKTYILTRAEQVGLSVSRVELTLRWETAGYWLPDSAILTGRGESRKITRLLGELSAELGIAEERLRWEQDGSVEGSVEEA